MSRLFDRLRHWRGLTELEKVKLAGVSFRAAITVLLPCLLLWLWIQGYYFEIFVGVVLINLVVSHGNRGFKAVSTKIEQRTEAKRLKVEKSHKDMIHYVTPSAFTMLYSELNKQELAEKTYADDGSHWIDAVRLFFDPFCDRTDKPPTGRFVGPMYLAMRAGVAIVPWVWVLGWLLAIGLVFAKTYPELLPGPLRGYLSSTTSFTIVLWVILVVWTVAWTAYILWLWPRDRFIITEYSYAETIRRTPWEVEKDNTGRTDYLTAILRRTTLPGKIFRYSHFEFQSWHDPEPIVYRRFVKDAERIQVLLNYFKEQNKTKEPPIVKVMHNRTRP